MNFDKYVNSGFYHLIEVIYELIILNLIASVTFILGAGVISFFPTLVATIVVIKSSSRVKTFSIIKAYFKTFFKYCGKALLLSLFYLVGIILLVIITYFYYCWLAESPENLFYGVLFYLSLFIDCVFLLAIFNAGFIFVYFPHLSYWKMVKYSFVLLKVVALKMLLLLFILITFIVLTKLFVYFAIFILFSLYIFLFNLLIKKVYTKILPKGMNSIDVSEEYLK